MKKLLLFLLPLLANLAHAQIYIPDVNLKSRLTSTESMYYATGENDGFITIDADADGEIQQSEALAVYKLDMRGWQVSDLTGLQEFQNLRELDGSYNNISAIPSGMSPHLEVLLLDNNQFSSFNAAPFTNLKRLSLTSNYALQSLSVANMPNLEQLWCTDNDMHTFSLTGLPSLKILHCSHNQLTTLNLAGVPALEYLRADGNPIASLNASMLPNLRVLHARDCNLTSLNITGLTQLEDLEMLNNPFHQVLDLSTNTNLQKLSAIGCQLTGLNTTGLQNLRWIYAYTNQIPSLDLSTNINLESLIIGGNDLSNLDLSANVNLKNVMCDGNDLVTLDVSHNLNLESLYVDNNGMTTLITVPLPNLGSFSAIYNAFTAINMDHIKTAQYLNLSHNQLTSMDLSDFHRLFSLYCAHNPALTSIFIKNGSPEHTLDFAGLPNLAYVCADERDLPKVQTQLNLIGNPNCSLNTYCSIGPAGEFDDISGVVRFDANGNGCDNTDPVMPGVRIDIADSAQSGSAFSNGSGHYGFGVYTSFVTVTPAIENPSYFTVTPPSQDYYFEEGIAYNETLNFCVSPNGIHHDVEVAIIPLGIPRPGFDVTYKVVYRNKGNQMASGTVAFGFDDSVFDLVESVPAASTQLPSLLQYNYAGLLPFESREILITLNLNGPMETPPVNNGDFVDLSASVVIPDIADDMPEDNSFTLHEEVVGSFDPNDKHCLEGAVVNPSQIGKYLHYQINFENTGTAPAENIIVRDVIDASQFEIESLQLLSASHTVDTRITGNKAEFVFEGIQLGAGEHGYVVFKIKTKNTLAVNSSVSNKADIFFDYNFPVTTDPAVTNFSVLGNEGFAIDDTVGIYPNPAGEFVNINAKETIKSVQLFDAQGRIVTTSVIGNTQGKIELSGLARGVYYIKVQTGKGIQTQKLLKN